MEQGRTQVYTGSGKGKTTAAVGLAVRAAGTGLHVYFGQFMKNNPTGELNVFALMDDAIAAEQYGTGSELDAPDAEADARAAQTGFEAAQAALTSGRYDIVVLDEVNVADHLEYLEPGSLLELVQARPSGVELVLTGRYASEEVMAAADLVTEMREVKHYFASGTPARRGIEF
ncbi:cob(I)yrinic acid a,c-diamide adenosyltransferase [Gordonibacter sp.]|uniref:cob(I)yrinic acid a,c-diamide adenosyltransferase n=1 Tax=Gordonibacter sp. TaxID=1968902 RepID=UPI002FC89C61